MTFNIVQMMHVFCIGVLLLPIYCFYLHKDWVWVFFGITSLLLNITRLLFVN